MSFLAMDYKNRDSSSVLSDSSINTDHHWMQRALKEARIAFDNGEVPVGAVLVSHGKLLASCHNQVEQLADATAHAEMLALTAAMNSLGTKYLPHATLYVTLEPCVMCMGAIRWAQIGRVVYGAGESRFGYQHLAPQSPHPACAIEGGVLESECKELMQSFFELKRTSGAVKGYKVNG